MKLEGRALFGSQEIHDVVKGGFLGLTHAFSDDFVGVAVSMARAAKFRR